MAFKYWHNGEPLAPLNDVSNSGLFYWKDGAPLNSSVAATPEVTGSGEALLAPVLGTEFPNVLTNGNFDGDADSWDLLSGWEYSSGAVHHNADGTAALRQLCPPETQYYLVQFTVSNWTQGTLLPVYGLVEGSPVSGSGTFTQIIKTTESFAQDLSQYFQLIPSNDARLTVDAVSIKVLNGGVVAPAGTGDALLAKITAVSEGNGVAGLLAAGILPSTATGGGNVTDFVGGASPSLEKLSCSIEGSVIDYIGTASPALAAIIAAGVGARGETGSGAAEIQAPVASGDGEFGIVVKPSSIGTAEVFGTPQVIPGAVTISPQGVAGAETFGIATITQIVKPSSIVSEEALGEPRAIPGAVTVSPSGIASAEALGSPKVVLIISPAGIESGEALGEPFVTQIIRPVGIPSEAIVSAPIVHPGPVFIFPPGIDGEEALGEPQVWRGSPPGLDLVIVWIEDNNKVTVEVESPDVLLWAEEFKEIVVNG